jgi:class 3 adenylate cyclase
MKCTACEFDNPNRMSFCGKCGAALAPRCSNCGFENPPEFQFCGKCGAELKGLGVTGLGVKDISSSQSPSSSLTPNRITPNPLSYTPNHLAEKILNNRSALEGERKQVTVLFADVKGSMELAEQVDPEDWHRILDRFFQILSDGVHRYEGTVNQYTGDGIMALFGAPIAHEDHARRACYAALRCTEELANYTQELKREHGLQFAVRMGLNSGEVVVGKIGDDLRMDYTAQGHTVGLAARMEQLSDPGKAYLSEHTAKMVEGFFRLGDLGRFNVKGVQEPVHVFEMQGVGPLRTRLDVSVRRGLTRFVGRHEEMEQLGRAWEAAQQGHGQIVAAMGEAGMGKSRLFYEFKVGRHPTEALILEAYSVSHGQASPYLPVVELLKSYFGISLEDDERTRREKVTGKVLTLDRQLEDALPHLFSVLGIPDPHSSLAQMDAAIRRRRTQEAVKRILVRETMNQPCIVVFEDLHWIDTETQAFLDLFTESVATARMLLLVNYRPQYEHGWASKSCYVRLRLDPLGRKEAEELLTYLLGDGAAEMHRLRDLVLEKTEGNPFFIEELVQTLVEEGVLKGNRGAYRLERSPTELHIPATVQGVLAARIDRLSVQDKDLLQTLAVLGKEFPFGLAREVAGQDEEALRMLLSHLQNAEFIYEQPAFPEPEYTFKHALTQEVAYGSVLVERRKELHERTARAIELLYDDRLDNHYAELAHHWGHTDDVPRAVEYLRLAGEQALERSAYGEAMNYLEEGLTRLATQQETPERDRLEASLQGTVGYALALSRSWGAPEAEAAFARARDLCERTEEPGLLYDALSGLWTVCLIRGDLGRTHELERRLIGIARQQRDPALLVGAHAMAGQTSFWFGHLGKAREHLEETIRLGDPVHGRAVRSREGRTRWDSLFARDCASHTLWYLGYADQGLTRSRESLSLTRTAPPALQAMTVLWAAVMHQHRGEMEIVREQAETVIALAEKHGIPTTLGFATLVRGWVLAEQKWGDLVAADTPLPTPWGKEEFEAASRASQEERRRLRREGAPEEALEELFTAERERMTAMLGANEHAGQVGAFEGASYQPVGLFRPEVDCIMFTRDEVGFCSVCSRAIERIIAHYSE